MKYLPMLVLALVLPIVAPAWGGAAPPAVTVVPDPRVGQKVMTKTAEPDVVEVSDIEDVTKKGGRGAAPENLRDLIGRFHPFMIHLPLALTVLLLLMELISSVFPRPWVQCGMFVNVLAFLSCLPAVSTGLMRAAQLSGGKPLSPETLIHRNIAITATALILLSLIVRISARDRLKGVPRLFYLLVVLAAALTIVVAGHLGGRLIFGDSYLDLGNILK
ncbi:MAG: DUF2231 domain-containing protein [Myxococcota bacterium]